MRRSAIFALIGALGSFAGPAFALVDCNGDQYPCRTADGEIIVTEPEYPER